jgi:hypothetical protein
LFSFYLFVQKSFIKESYHYAFSELIGEQPTKWAIPQTKIIVVTTLFKPHQQVHVAAALAGFHFI